MATDITRRQVDRLIRAGQFEEFLRELGGWDTPTSPQAVPVTLHPPKGSDAAPVTWTLRPIVQKLEIVVFACEPGPDGRIPDGVTRRRIERELTAYAYLHLIVFHDATFVNQVWQWTLPAAGNRVRPYEKRVSPGDSLEDLFQRLQAISFSLDEEGTLTHADVVNRLNDAFRRDKVTKKFYERFKQERGMFEGFIKGLRDDGERSQYAALMLNRLMFVYFIQKKNFLDRDPDYLNDRFRRVRSGELRDTEVGPGFHSFYRQFLRRLFHEGLDTRAIDRDPKLRHLIGDVPYLNGGFFEIKDLERQNPDLDIDDEAFEKILSFFGQYHWHLDDRPLENDRQINPDVLGYIFEKFINQKEMGAYYTKEDITGYICQNTILPWILDSTRRDCKIAFDKSEPGNVWELLQATPDRYIYPAVQHGVIDSAGKVIGLPEEIAAGVDDVAQRGNWNTRAYAPYNLPTETWREYVHRRQRCLELREKLSDGEIHTVDDLVTWNLDIREFTADVVQECGGEELVKSLWKAIEKITVLDPTCGSGAFLFAALEVLEPLHDACLTRMQAFVASLPDRPHPNQMPVFRKAVAAAEPHKNRRYFVLRQIVLHNLYGVDIMAEAVEICKLRLFLKLVAQLDDAGQIEPLPDIDFNIRTGNTLVGFAREDEIRTAIDRNVGGGKVQLGLDLSTTNEKARIFEDIRQAGQAFIRYQEMQDGTEARADMRDAKATYRRRLDELRDKLDYYLAGQYPGSQTARGYFETWRESHQPFHWFVDFHVVVQGRGGFDVIVGNPPYLVMSKARKQYTPLNYVTDKSSDIYALVMERASVLTSRSGYTGMIVPLSLAFSGDFTSLRTLLQKCYAINWFSSFARIPAALFASDVRVRNVIHIGRIGEGSNSAWTSVLHRWFEEARPRLLANLGYSRFQWSGFNGLIPKLNSTELGERFANLQILQPKAKKRNIGELISAEREWPLYFRSSAYNWLSFTPEVPPAFDSDGTLTPQTKFITAGVRKVVRHIVVRTGPVVPCAPRRF